MKLATIVFSVICVSMLVGCGTAEKLVNDAGSLVSNTDLKANLSGDITEEVVIYDNARICDPSGCYIAWNVVDSDGDGVSDADELVAGTNPFDPQSRPSLKIVAELGGEKKLPSFEAGLGTFVIFPPELQTMKEKNQQNPFGELAFPIDRGDSLTRLGISNELLSQYNIDLTSDGLTFGPLGKPTDESGNIIGDIPELRVSGIEVSLISADLPGSDPKKDDYLAPLVVKDEMIGGDRVRTYADGSVRNDFHDGGGRITDKNGKIIKDWYVNPDADQVTDKPTPEQEEATLRLRGAVILTVENWSAPNSGSDPRNPRDLIILVDPDYQYGTAFIYEAPRVTGAQPETRPDLPNPGVSANPEDFKDSCVVGCP